MKRTQVKSSVLKSVGYDEATRTLEVEFARDGDVYAFFPVPPGLFAELMRAASVGTFFDQRIRHHFIYRRT